MNIKSYQMQPQFPPFFAHFTRKRIDNRQDMCYHYLKI